ncbi:MAG: AsmA family protein, partial [Deltaproteobacteria bacterium]|nr:AsmA family protein [Deltaproteobacteria bacterium]
MRVSKPLRWILYILGGLVATLLLIIILLSVIRIPIDLSSQKGLVESTASLALGRTVKIDDKIVITTSVRPIFSLEGLRISNPKGFEKGDFLKMKTAEIQVRLLPLLLGKLQISKFSVKGLAVMLVENKTGAVNWSSQTPEKSKSEPPPPPKPSSEESRLELTSDSLVLAKLVLEDILVDYRSPSQAEPLQFKIDECTGDMLPGRPFILSMKGKLVGEPYVTTIEIGSLQELVEDNRSRMEVKTEIAKTQFDFAGSLDLARALRSLHLNAMVTGERLDSLNGLLDLDLPPLKSYKAAAQLAMRRDRIDLTDLILQVGKSKLTGKLTADRSGGKPQVAIELNSPLIQLNDFDLGDWSPEKGDAGQPEVSQDRDKKADTAKPDNDKSATDQAVEELLSPKVLARFNVGMNVKAEKVMSGADALGSGVLTATLKDGQFALDPVKLNIPGGSFAMAATLKPDPKAPEASLRMLMKNFDFGVLVRRANPKADMGGTINLDVDLKSSANSFDKLMA